MARLMEIDTPLGPDVLLFHGMSAREEMNRLFEYQLDLLSEKSDIVIDDILGKGVTVKVALEDDSERYFNGVVTRFAQGGRFGRYFRYVATVRPWLWFLTRTADCRIFQQQTVPDILKTVFADHPSDVQWDLTGTYRQWTYCVQYRETDFNFVSRLMEQEGIGYYFKHSDGHNTLVLTDSTSSHTAASHCPSLPFVEPQDLVNSGVEHVSAWDFSREIQPGVYVHTDYDLERPSVKLLTKKPLSRTYQPSDYEVFDYPGLYLDKGDGSQYAHVRIDELGSQFEVARGASNARGVTVGALLELSRYPREDQNREYLVLATNYQLLFEDYETLPGGGSGASVECTFEVMPSSQQYRPRRLTPKPFVQGPQTAVVVGPGGDEIYTDKYARVKVQFHWDRYGKKDENSSCWLRVSSAWAGQNWGQISIPRIKQEVIVDFLEGDPDQPIVTGRVYNAEQMPPYDLPANKTQSGVKSRSSTGGAPANFNELRFEDKKGSEQVFLHAEKNQDIEVENDETHWVGHDRKKTIDHDETTLVKHDRTETVDNNETITVHGNRTEKVMRNESITIVQNRDVLVSKSETKTVALQRTHTVGVNETITVGAAQEVTVGGAQTISVGAVQSTSVGANHSLNVGSNSSSSVGGNQSFTVGGNLSMSTTGNESWKVTGGRATSVGKDDALEVGKKLTIVAADAVMIKTGDASIEMKKDGTIKIKGKDITIEGTGKINVKASSDLILKGSKIAGN